MSTVYGLLLVALLYYIVEIFLPYVEKTENFRLQCEDKGGFVYEDRGKKPVCIKKEYKIIL